MTYYEHEDEQPEDGDEVTGEVLFSGKVWGLTQDRRSIKIVRSGPGMVPDAEFEGLREVDVVVLRSQTPTVPFIVRKHRHQFGRFEVVDTTCDNVVAKTYNQEDANKVRDALTAAAAN